MTKITTDELERLGACVEGRRWAAQYGTLAEAWLACERPEWMLWYLSIRCPATNTPEHWAVVLAKSACARLVLHLYEAAYPGDDRPRQALEMAERYGRGEIEYGAVVVDAATISAALAAVHAAAGGDDAAYTVSASECAAAAYAAYLALAPANAFVFAAVACAASLAAVYVCDGGDYVANAAVSASTAFSAASVSISASRQVMMKNCADAIRAVVPNFDNDKRGRSKNQAKRGASRRSGPVRPSKRVAGCF